MLVCATYMIAPQNLSLSQLCVKESTVDFNVGYYEESQQAKIWLKI